jgi:hypothetical protein
LTLFVDNDVLAKLASWNLLAEGVKACGFELSAVRYLPTARYALGIGKPRCKYSLEVQQRIEALFAAGKASDDDAADQDRNLPQVSDIDPGEALLIAQAARAAGSLLVTGDKNAFARRPPLPTTGRSSNALLAACSVWSRSCCG